MAVPKVLKWTLIGSLVPGALGGYLIVKGFALGFLGDVGGAATSLESERAAARSEGIPLEPRELFPNRPLDPKKNAGPIVAKETLAIKDATPTDGPFLQAYREVRKGTAGDWHESEIRKHVARLEPQLKRLSAARLRPECDFGKDYSLGPYVEFPEFAAIKTAVNVLCAKAWIDTKAGRYSDAQNSFSTAFWLAQCAGKEPALIGMLVQIACSTIAHDALRRALSLRPNDSRNLSMARAVLKVADSPIEIHRALRGEVVFGVATLKNLKSLKELESLSGEAPPAELKSDFFVPRMRKAWEARHIQLWRRIFKRLPKDPYAYLTIGEIVESESDWENNQKSMDHVMNRILMPVFREASLACSREKAQFLLSLVKLELLEYRRKNNSFPSKLDVLGQAFLDPFDKKPLRYEKAEAGFKIWSIDRDLRDDGGLVRTTAGGPLNSPGDLVVQFP